MSSLKVRVRKLGELYELERVRALEDVQRILAAMPKPDKLVMMAGLEAEARGEPYPEDFDEVMARFKKRGGWEAQRRLSLFESEKESENRKELSRRMSAGESWREIRL